MTEVLDVRDLSISLGPGLKPVTGVAFSVAASETLGIVGESGCGKSITMMALMGLLPKSAEITGSIRLMGEELVGKSDNELAEIRGRRIGMIFQDPMTSLNPVLTVGEHLGEAIRLHQPHLSRRARADRALELLRLVAIPFPEQRLRQYPHELSGGMRQRVMIAMAMANDPQLLIADEPTTALDVTIQAQILDLLMRLQAERGMAIVLISHDLGLIADSAAQVAVMYGGRVCERGDVSRVLTQPIHPYTRGLLGSIPTLDGEQTWLPTIPGGLPSLAERPSGCRFHPRCEFAGPVCSVDDPQLNDVSGRQVACHFAAELSETHPRAVAI